MKKTERKRRRGGERERRRGGGEERRRGGEEERRSLVVEDASSSTGPVAARSGLWGLEEDGRRPGVLL